MVSKQLGDRGSKCLVRLPNAFSRRGGIWRDRHRTGPIMEIGMPVQDVVVRGRAGRW